MIDHPKRYPVIIHDQTDAGRGLEIFCGLALRLEDAYGGAKRYTGRISAIRIRNGCGQNEAFEIHHGLDHFSKRNSACYWIYPDEIEIMLYDFNESWDMEEKQKEIKKIMRYLNFKSQSIQPVNEPDMP